MSNQNHVKPVPATPVTDVHEESNPPGAFEVIDSYLWFLCPCGCGSYTALPITAGPKDKRSWSWDGNRLQPTIAPSIRQLSGCYFHGHLTNGVWTFEGDSGTKPR